MSNSINKGFLLTRQVHDIGNTMELIYWIKTDLGPVKLTINNEKCIFFVESKYLEYALSLLNSLNLPFTHKRLRLTTFAEEKVHALYFNQLNQFYKAREALKSNGIKCYEDDIRPEDRYLMERFVSGSLMFSGELLNTTEKPSSKSFKEPYIDSLCKRGDYQGSSKHTYTEYHQVKAKQCEYQPDLTMLSIDIECSLHGELYSIGCYADSVEKVFMIGDSEKNAQSYIEWVDNECDLLYRFIEWVNHIDPDIIIGWNVINFDFKLMQRRCERHNIKFAIGRDGTVPFWRQNKLSPEQNFILIAGRVVLDGIDLLKTATYSFPSFSLENVAQAILGIGKKIDDVDNRVEEITHKFHHHKQDLAKYNLEDCRLVWLIFKKTQLLQFAILRSSLTGLELDRVGGSVAAFTNLYLPKLHRSGYVAPNMGDGESDLISPGGFVMNSIPNLYKNVLVLDFKSLYPSIIRTFKVDPLGLISGIKEKAINQTDYTTIPGFDGAEFSREKHFLPDIIERLWTERDKAKKDNNEPLSQAIKIIMNSFYGILGSTGCRFFDPRLSGSITKRSHQLLNTTKDWIEALDYQVIYGDTDSIFVSVGKDKTDMQCQNIGKELMEFINARWREELLTKYQIDSKLEIEFETHFHQFLMPTVRGQDIGTKKRYAGLVGRGNQEKLIFKGLESVRTDWTQLAKMFQQELYTKVFKQQPVEEYILQMVKDTSAGKFDQHLIYRKRLRRKLSEYQKNIPPHVKAARHADEENKKLGLPLQYQNKGWIEYVMTQSGPQTLKYRNANIDHQFYIDRQLEAIADGILPFINKSFHQIIDDQLQLF